MSDAAPDMTPGFAFLEKNVRPPKPRTKGITEIRGVKGRRFGFRPNTRFTHPFRSRPRAFGVDRAGSARLRRGDVLLRGRHPIYTQLGA